MELKFTFGGSADHSHSDEQAVRATPGAQLPIVGGAAPQSGSPEMRVTLEGSEVRCAVVGAGTEYASASVAARELTPTAIASAVRSALARAHAELPDSMRGTVSAVSLELGDDSPRVLAELGATAELASGGGDGGEVLVDEALQARTGLVSGTPIRLGQTD